MTLESHGGFGPERIRRVPDMDGKLDSRPYEKAPLTEVLGKPFSADEARHYARMSSAASPEELAFAINDFNEASGKKDASAFDMSLDDMLIEEQTISLANGATVSVERAANGITTFALIAPPKPFSA